MLTRTPSSVSATAWVFAMLYSLRLMHNDAAGMPTEAPSIIRMASEFQETSSGKTAQHHLQMSHQMGAQLMALLCQTMELMNWLRQESAAQIM